MNEVIIPDDVKLFILQNIDSIAQWEGLLFLRAHREKEWDAPTIARNLYIRETQAAQILAQLSSQGFLAITLSGPTVLYRYEPKTPELEPLLARAADHYARYLVPMTNLIHAQHKSRIQEFADAFKLRKD